MQFGNLTFAVLPLGDSSICPIPLTLASASDCKAAMAVKRHLVGLLAYPKHCITKAVAEGTKGRIPLIKGCSRVYQWSCGLPSY